MERIIPPIRTRDQGSAVANLHDALLFLAEKRHVGPDGLHLREWRDILSRDLACQSFGPDTIRLFRRVLDELGLPTSDGVDDAIATRLNRLLTELGAFSKPTESIVSVEVRQSSGEPYAGVIVRAFDQDLRSRQSLGAETRTDERGGAVIVYEMEQAALAEAARADLTFEVLMAVGVPLQIQRLLRVVDGLEQPVSNPPVIFNAGPDETVVLIAGRETGTGYFNREGAQ